MCLTVCVCWLPELGFCSPVQDDQLSSNRNSLCSQSDLEPIIFFVSSTNFWDYRPESLDQFEEPLIEEKREGSDKNIGANLGVSCTCSGGLVIGFVENGFRG